MATIDYLWLTVRFVHGSTRLTSAEKTLCTEVRETTLYLDAYVTG